MNYRLAHHTRVTTLPHTFRKFTNRIAPGKLLFSGLLLTSVALYSGCSPNSSRLGVEGNVTVDGNPLPLGKISFTPLPGTPSPTAGATITDGYFQVPADKGLRAGTFRVEIKAVRATGKQMRDDLSGEVIERREQYIPARYNENSELTAEIKAGDSEPLEFAISEK
ncbi:MAG: hypothetical protein WD468_07755 [Pirellulales bacterium]